MRLTMDEFAELEEELSAGIMTTSKSTKRSSIKTKFGDTNEVQSLFQNIIANTSIPDVEELDSKKITRGGRNWKLILPAIFGGGIFLGIVIFFDIIAFKGSNQNIILTMFFALILIPFNLFAIACLGFGLGEIINPSNTLQEVLVQTWYDRSKRLILIIRYIYDVEDEELPLNSTVEVWYKFDDNGISQLESPSDVGEFLTFLGLCCLLPILLALLFIMYFDGNNDQYENLEPNSNNEIHHHHHHGGGGLFGGVYFGSPWYRRPWFHRRRSRRIYGGRGGIRFGGIRRSGGGGRRSGGRSRRSGGGSRRSGGRSRRSGGGRRSR